MDGMRWDTEFRRVCMWDMAKQILEIIVNVAHKLFLLVEMIHFHAHFVDTHDQYSNHGWFKANCKLWMNTGVNVDSNYSASISKGMKAVNSIGSKIVLPLLHP